MHSYALDRLSLCPAATRLSPFTPKSTPQAELHWFTRHGER